MSGSAVAHVPTPAVPASIGRRVGAYAIDAAIGFGVVAVLGGVVAGVLQAVLHPDTEEGLAALILWITALLYLVGIAWALVYTGMQGARGSLGQRAVGVRLADAATGGPIGFWRALLRNVVWGLAGSIVVGYFSPLFDSSGRRQGWHDMVGRDIVIDVKATDAAAAVPPPAFVPTANPYLPPPAGAVGAAPPLPAPPPLSFAPATPGFAPATTTPAGHVPNSPVDVPANAGSVRAGDESSGHAGAPPRPTSPVYAPPAAAAPAAPVAPTGLISAVPGVTSPSAAAAPAAGVSAPASVPAPASAPAPAVPPAPVAPPAPAASDGVEDLDSTRAAAPAAPATPPVAVLVWDNGTRIAVYGSTLFGRNPAREDGSTVVAVRDETLSLSKTHFEVGGDASGAWVVDRHSTNGVALVRGTGRHTLVPGERTTLRAGDRLEFGDRSATVEASA